MNAKNVGAYLAVGGGALLYLAFVGSLVTGCGWVLFYSEWHWFAKVMAAIILLPFLPHAIGLLVTLVTLAGSIGKRPG